MNKLTANKMYIVNRMFWNHVSTRSIHFICASRGGPSDTKCTTRGVAWWFPDLIEQAAYQIEFMNELDKNAIKFMYELLFSRLLELKLNHVRSWTCLLLPCLNQYLWLMWRLYDAILCYMISVILFFLKFYFISD